MLHHSQQQLKESSTATNTSLTPNATSSNIISGGSSSPLAAAAPSAPLNISTTPTTPAIQALNYHFSTSGGRNRWESVSASSSTSSSVHSLSSPQPPPSAAATVITAGAPLPHAFSFTNFSDSVFTPPASPEANTMVMMMTPNNQQHQITKQQQQQQHQPNTAGATTITTTTSSHNSSIPPSSSYMLPNYVLYQHQQHYVHPAQQQQSYIIHSTQHQHQQQQQHRSPPLQPQHMQLNITTPPTSSASSSASSSMVNSPVSSPPLLLQSSSHQQLHQPANQQKSVSPPPVVSISPPQQQQQQQQQQQANIYQQHSHHHHHRPPPLQLGNQSAFLLPSFPTPTSVQPVIMHSISSNSSSSNTNLLMPITPATPMENPAVSAGLRKNSKSFKIVTSTVVTKQQQPLQNVPSSIVTMSQENLTNQQQQSAAAASNLLRHPSPPQSSVDQQQQQQLLQKQPSPEHHYVQQQQLPVSRGSDEPPRITPPSTVAHETTSGGHMSQHQQQHTSQTSMPPPTPAQQPQPVHTDDDDDDDEYESDKNKVVEESPDGRWSKRNEPLTTQRDMIPAIDEAYLAMDTENGFEVVWNEIFYKRGANGSTGNSSSDSTPQHIDAIFYGLVQLSHPNIVKFHGYWTDQRNQNRIIFITEYMSSGSLKAFLRKAKKTAQPIKRTTWRRWCIQLLSALHYMHNNDPAQPVIHGALTSDSIYMQHNGLIKIGSIAPDIVNTHVKTLDSTWWSKNLHYLAPELLNGGTGEEAKSTAIDIYAFGIVALEIFCPELGGNGDTHAVTSELIKQSIDALEDPKQRDFLNKCLQKDPKMRPTAEQLLFHPLLFEVPSLRLIAAHFLGTCMERVYNDSEKYERKESQEVFATCPVRGISVKYSDLSKIEANKYIEDVKNGVYPLVAFGQHRERLKRNQAAALAPPPPHTTPQTQLSNTTSPSHSTSPVELSDEHLQQQYSHASNTSSPQQQQQMSGQQQQDPMTSSLHEDVLTQQQQHQQLLQQQQHQQPRSPPIIYQSPQHSLAPTPTSQYVEPLQQQQQQSSSRSPPPPSQFYTVSHHTSIVSPPPQHQTLHHVLTDPNFHASGGGGAYASLMNGSTHSAPMGSSSVAVSSSSSLSRTESPVVYGSAVHMQHQQPQSPEITFISIERRHAERMQFSLEPAEKDPVSDSYKLSLYITFEDHTNRFVESLIMRSDTAMKLADELIAYGLVSEVDRDNLNSTLHQALLTRRPDYGGTNAMSTSVTSESSSVLLSQPDKTTTSTTTTPTGAHPQHQLSSGDCAGVSM